MYIEAAISYAESYQHLKEGYYNENVMSPVTEQAVIMLSSHFMKAVMVVQGVSLLIPLLQVSKQEND